MRFSLRTLICWLTIGCVLLATFFVFGPSTATITLALANAMALAGLLSAIVYGAGNRQAFCMGAFLPYAVIFCCGVWRAFDGFHSFAMGDPIEWWRPYWRMTLIPEYWMAMSIFAWITAPICGLVSLSVRHIVRQDTITPKQRTDEPSDAPPPRNEVF